MERGNLRYGNIVKKSKIENMCHETRQGKFAAQTNQNTDRLFNNKTKWNLMHFPTEHLAHGDQWESS